MMCLSQLLGRVMNKRFFSFLRYELTLQWRYAIMQIYLAALAITGGTYFALKEFMPDWFLSLVVFTDSAPLGFFFLGGMMLLEKNESVRDAMAVTQLSAGEYFFAKAIPFVSLSLIGVSIIALISESPTNWPLYLGAICLASISYLGLGAWLGVRMKTVTGYITMATMVFMPIILPSMIALMEPMPLYAAILPSAAQFDLIIAGLRGTDLSLFRLGMLSLSSVIGCVITVRLGLGALRREFGEK